GTFAQLSFHHIITQEVAYGSLLQVDRKTRHRRAAEVIESLYRGRTDEVCDQLADHWLQSDQPIAALPYLVTAADSAVAIGASREAIAHLQHALELTASQAETVSVQQREAIRFKLAGLLFVVGER